jgi:hypothetical protein
MNVPDHSRIVVDKAITFLSIFLSMLHIFMTFFLSFNVLPCKQALRNTAATVGYVMKPSREEDFAKVSPL